MTDYTPRMYTQKFTPLVEANRFNGTPEMARWLADQDSENLTAMRTMVSTDPKRRGEVSIKVRTAYGAVYCRPGDWILNNERGEWHAMSDYQFRARYLTDDHTDPDDPYNQEES